jgi:hypothetical protein
MHSHPGLGDGPIYLDYNATTPVDPRVIAQAADRKPSCEDHLRSLNATDPSPAGVMLTGCRTTAPPPKSCTR